MDNLIFSANIVFPLFMMMAAGFVLKKIKWMSEAFLISADKLVFRFFLPSILFYNIYSADLKSLVNFKFIIFSVLGLIIVNGIAIFIVPFFVKDNGRRGTIIQAMTRSNFILIGIPICQAAYGAVGTASVSVLAAVFIPVSNFFAVLALSLYNNRGRSNFMALIKGIITNPFIFTAALAVIINLLKIKFPFFAVKAVQDVATMSTPFALIVLGAQIKSESLKNNIRAIIAATSMKLIFFPALVLAAAYSIGFRGLEFCMLLAAFGSPVAVSSYVMAKTMHCDDELAAQMIVSTTLFSIVTIFAFIFAAKSLAIL